MAKRKSLLAKMYAAHQKTKEQRRRAEERARREYEVEARRFEAQVAKEAEQQRRAEERAAQAQLKQQQQAERARQQAAAQQEKERRAQAAAQLREQQRQQAEAKREQQRQAVEDRLLAVQRRLAEAEFRTEAVRAQITGLERLLQDRNRSLVASSRWAEDVFNTQGSEPFVAALQQALAMSIYPDNMQGSCAAMYRPEAGELLVEYELPRQSAVPIVAAYRYVRSKDFVQPEPRKEAEIKKLYEELIARVALRTLAEAFDIAPVTLVSGIVFNGYVSAKDRATGKPIRPLLISIHATRDAFAEILLDEPELDPVMCLRGYLNAVISPHPYDFEAVRPVIQFDLSKYKFVEEMDVVAGLDSRPDLLTLKPVEFEHLIRQLFEAIGMKSWVTQASRDEGVDGVAVNEDPIVGGLCVIQAKRYSKIVGLEAVHALAGVMNDKCAAKGVLVTTSWVGKASRDFAARNGRIEIIEGRHLKAMLLEHLGLDVLISLPKLPPGWEQSDVL
ncbi:MAG: restriction endonuclease [Pseudomonas sp.]|uniref:restriction endonuclease n=1 Tax=Pseudomonas sp. TaxID=306 RepID=UPI003D6FAB03